MHVSIDVTIATVLFQFFFLLWCNLSGRIMRGTTTTTTTTTNNNNNNKSNNKSNNNKFNNNTLIGPFSLK